VRLPNASGQWANNFTSPALGATFLIGCGVTVAAALAVDRQLRTPTRAALPADDDPEPG